MTTFSHSNIHTNRRTNTYTDIQLYSKWKPVDIKVFIVVTNYYTLRLINRQVCVCFTMKRYVLLATLQLNWILPLNVFVFSDRLIMCQNFDRPDCVSNCRNMPDGLYPWCADCRKYAICHGEHVQIKACPNKQYWGFDSTTRECRYKSPDCYDCTGMHERTHIHVLSTYYRMSNSPHMSIRYICGIATSLWEVKGKTSNISHIILSNCFKIFRVIRRT